MQQVSDELFSGTMLGFAMPCIGFLTGDSVEGSLLLTPLLLPMPVGPSSRVESAVKRLLITIC